MHECRSVEVNWIYCKELETSNLLYALSLLIRLAFNWSGSMKYRVENWASFLNVLKNTRSLWLIDVPLFKCGQINALKDLGLDVIKGTVATEGPVKQTKFYITRLWVPPFLLLFCFCFLQLLKLWLCNRTSKEVASCSYVWNSKIWFPCEGEYWGLPTLVKLIASLYIFLSS